MRVASADAEGVRLALEPGVDPLAVLDAMRAARAAAARRLPVLVALIAFGARVYRTGITHRAGRASVYATRS